MPTFGYTRDIPESDHSPSTDQPNMRTNTNSTDSLISIDHFSFEQNNFDGTHKQVQLRNTGLGQGAIPAGLQGTGWETIYSSATNPVPAVVPGAPVPINSGAAGELWFVRGATATGIQLTGPGTPTPADNGYTFLPGGILIQWGFVTGYVSTTDILFPIPFLNNVFNIQVTQFNATNTADQRAVSATFVDLTKFKVRITTLGSTPLDSSGKINYVAIGN